MKESVRNIYIAHLKQLVTTPLLKGLYNGVDFFYNLFDAEESKGSYNKIVQMTIEVLVDSHGIAMHNNTFYALLPVAPLNVMMKIITFKDTQIKFNP